MILFLPRKLELGLSPYAAWAPRYGGGRRDFFRILPLSVAKGGMRSLIMEMIFSNMIDRG
jgi:hypothetical protein